MDAKIVGATIAALRKRAGKTQAELAAALSVSDKTISKWEGGHGYPEITQFPALANLFGVTVDYLMSGERKGIAIAGNILLDQIKAIDEYPKEGMLCNISSISRSVGGCVPNTAINLAKIDRSIPITAYGRIGDDEQGRYVAGQMSAYGINVDKLCVDSDAPTSFTDVMSVRGAERTFFHARGTNALFGPEDVDLSTLNCSMFHIGYILLLDRFDAEDAEYGTVMARFLHDLQERGIKTSYDVVSDSAGNYKAKIVPAMKYTDYAISNEIECCTAWDLDPRNADGSLNIENIRKAMELAAEAGVREKVIVHCKEAGFLLNAVTGEFTIVPSLKIPKSEMVGSVGAGDAYCSGCLYAIYNKLEDAEILKFASAAAACNLFAANAVDGMRTKNEIAKMEEKYGRLEL
ncbi:MAG: helix-turn-helix domain-containing protein [Clostridia bacterium]|nr:helix-turn-helix domain-containing protein [Clostridia bacterium]